MRRSSKRLGRVLESYEHAASMRDPRPAPAVPATRRAAAGPLTARERDSDLGEHEAYLAGVATQARSYLDGLRAGERVMMHFEYHTLSPIDGGPRDIDVLDLLRELCRRDGFSFESEPLDDIGVHLVPAAAVPRPVPLRRG